MSIYDNVPLIELERELLTYASCRGTVVLVGITIEEGSKFIPSGLQIWSRDETDEEAEGQVRSVDRYHVGFREKSQV